MEARQSQKQSLRRYRWVRIFMGSRSLHSLYSICAGEASMTVPHKYGENRGRMEASELDFVNGK